MRKMIPLTESRCKVCTSPNRRKYEELRLKEKKSLSDLEKVAHELGERVSKSMFSRHFNRHVFEKLKELVELDDERKQLLQEKIGESIDILSDLRRYSRVLGEAVKPYAEKKERLSPKELSALNLTIRNIRENLKLLLDLTNQLEIKGETEEVRKEKEELIRVVRKLDPETQRKLYDAMEEEGLI